MRLFRGELLRLAASVVPLVAMSRLAFGQAFPSRTVRLISGYAAGGVNDILARLMGQWLSERLGQVFLVENRPGAGSNIATEVVIHAPPDGYSLLLVGGANAINATLYDNLNFNFMRDIAPVACIGFASNVLVVTPAFPAKTIPEFIAYAKANPGQVTMASAGIGSPQHISGELFKMMAGVDMIHVPYRGGAPALADLISGQVQVYFASTVSSIEYIKTGKLRPLGITSAARSEILPDVPPIGDFVPGYEASGWFGIGTPRNTPATIVETLNREVNAGLAEAALMARFAELGITPVALSPVAFGKLLAEETEKWGKVVRFANIKPE